ncbi:unnamed protein product, partial [Discosporangium mesarthrocarpum]
PPPTIRIHSPHPGLRRSVYSDPRKMILTISRNFCPKRYKVVDSFLYVGGEDAAKEERLLARSGITHILNCAGPQCPNYLEQ